MAQPILLELTPRDPRAELRAKLDNAPLEHAEALLAAYEVLQGLHDQGALEILRGMVGSKDKILEIIVDAAKTPEAIQGLRNLIILTKLAASFEPEFLKGMADAVHDGMARAKEQEPLTLLQLLKKLSNEDSRRAMTALTCTLESVGKVLGASHPD